MRMEVFWPYKHRRVSEKAPAFHAMPVENNKRRPANEKELSTLKEMLPKINSIGKQVLGDFFHKVSLNEEEGRLEIVTSRGVVSELKKDFDSFRGWVELCAMK